MSSSRPFVCGVGQDPAPFSLTSHCDQLDSSSGSLLQVADYCQSSSSYTIPQAMIPLTGVATVDRRAKRGAAAACIQNKRRQTLSFAIQSVASVAYDIANLASAMNSLIDGLETELDQLDRWSRRVQTKARLWYEKTCRQCIGSISVPIRVEQSQTDISLPQQHSPSNKADFSKPNKSVRIDNDYVASFLHRISLVEDTASTNTADDGISIYGGSWKPESTPKTNNNNNEPTEFIEKVISVYAYQSQQTDELTFAQNTIIYVVSKNADGWSQGVTACGKTGLFPNNYVKLIE